jgi:hypothetical protein
MVETDTRHFTCNILQIIVLTVNSLYLGQVAEMNAVLFRQSEVFYYMTMETIKNYIHISLKMNAVLYIIA